MPLFGPPNIEKLKEKRDVRGLLKALGHKDARIRLNAENALNEMGTEVAGRIFIGLFVLLEENAKVRQGATETLQKLGASAVEPVFAEILEAEPLIVAADKREHVVWA
ncbi:unnamed protein product, partial [marine sediment metagenome]